MSSEANLHTADVARLTLEELVAVQPKHLRGKLERGMREPEGERPGRGRAQSLDFEGLAAYQHGDDIRSIDWRASLRSGETTVRRFASASHRARMIALDLKPSLYFATDERLMAKTACLTAAWIAWTANIVNEPVGLSVLGKLIEPRRGRRRVLQLLDAISSAFEEAKDIHTYTHTDPDPIDFEAIAGATGQADEICVVGETPVDPASLIRVGRTFSTVRTLRFFVVDDPFAAEPPRPGRYPVRTADGERKVITIRATDPDQNDTLSQLADAGWRIEHARSLLPRAR